MLLVSGGLSWSFTEKAWPQDLVISEFVAVNDTVALDEDDDSSDLIELHNPGPRAVDLEGWYLTDDAVSLQKWRFPRTGEAHHPSWGRSACPSKGAPPFVVSDTKAAQRRELITSSLNDRPQSAIFPG